jgi:hypothetical protein
VQIVCRRRSTETRRPPPTDLTQPRQNVGPTLQIVVLLCGRSLGSPEPNLSRVVALGSGEPSYGFRDENMLAQLQNAQAESE